jgi:phosphoadenosine phosphosulfate reductase
MSPTTMVRSTEELAELAESAAARLDGQPAEEIIEWAAQTFAGRFCVTSSFNDAVLAHLASRVTPGVEIIFLDTGLHFVETLLVRESVQLSMPVTVRSVRPGLTVAEQEDRHGPRLWERDPDACCAMRKVEPLERVLGDYDAWAAGLRRSESPARAHTPVIQYEHSRGKIKVAPLAAWSDAAVAAYIAEHRVPVNGLVRAGYGSVGCSPCTERGADRDGRWPLFEKTECGLHR